MSKGIIVEKSIIFSLEIMKICRELNNHKLWDLSRQLFKSATSIGANIHEAQSARSLKDFIQKMSISLKEARETEYWLILIIGDGILNNLEKIKKLKEYCVELIKILTSILVTSNKELNQSI